MKMEDLGVDDFPIIFRWGKNFAPGMCKIIGSTTYQLVQGPSTVAIPTPYPTHTTHHIPVFWRQVLPAEDVNVHDSKVVKSSRWKSYEKDHPDVSKSTLEPVQPGWYGSWALRGRSLWAP